MISAGSAIKTRDLCGVCDLCVCVYACIYSSVSTYYDYRVCLCVCVYVCMASRIYSVCIYSVRVYLLCMRVSTPSTQNPDERARSDRARSDRAHATPGRVGAA